MHVICSFKKLQHKRKRRGKIFFLLTSYLFVMTATFKSKRKNRETDACWFGFYSKPNFEGDNNVRSPLTRNPNNVKMQSS